MKTLYLIRHAKSSWDYPELTDFERPLNKRGKRDAPYMGQLLADMKVKPELIISSPALRAYYTARIIAGRIGYPFDEIETAESIYKSDAGELIELIQLVEDEYNSLMLFGHNPALTQTSNYLSDKHLDNIPTCGIVCIEFKTETWKEIKPDNGKFVFFEYPKKYFGKKK
jgi:phosphohistidine phosphatase